MCALLQGGSPKLQMPNTWLIFGSTQTVMSFSGKFGVFRWVRDISNCMETPRGCPEARSVGGGVHFKGTQHPQEF